MPALRPWVLRLGAPALLMAVIVTADVASGRAVVYDLLCAVPLLAALLDRPRRVLAWGVLCVALQLLLGVYDHVYDTRDRQLAQGFRLTFTIATTLGATTLSARRLRELARSRRVQAAAAIAQQAILRPVPPALGACRLRAVYRAAARDTLVGGDFYDALHTDDGSVLAVIGDVRGHGLPAVHLAADILGAFRSFAAVGQPMGEVVAAMDAIVAAHGGPEDFATAALVRISADGELAALVAGHPSPLVLRHQRRFPLKLGGDPALEQAPPLGLLLGRQPAPLTGRLHPGDRLVLYTDGLAEARDRDGRFLPVDSTVAALGGRTTVELLPDALVGAARKWAVDDLSDDAAVLVLEFAPDPAITARPGASWHLAGASAGGWPRPRSLRMPDAARPDGRRADREAWSPQRRPAGSETMMRQPTPTTSNGAPRRAPLSRRLARRVAQGRPRQVVVVTGASAGIGRATAVAFAQRGDLVVLLARGERGLQAAAADVEAAGGAALPIQVDVADFDAVQAAASRAEQEMGPIDIWVNNAFSSVFAPFMQVSMSEFKRTTEVTYLGFVHGTRAALERMLPRDRGLIVQVGSALAYRGIPLQSAYCGAKHAIQGFHESLRTELLHEHSEVRTTMVQLPAVNTPQFDWVLSRLRRHPQPVPPIYQPEVIAKAIVRISDHPRRREYYVGSSAAVTIFADKVAAGLLDRYLARTGYHSQQTAQPTSPDRPANLWEPMDDDRSRGAHGSFDGRAHGRSLHAELTTRAPWPVALAVDVGAAVGAGVRMLVANRKAAPGLLRDAL